MSVELAKNDLLSKLRLDEELQALVNLIFMNMVLDPFLNGQTLLLAMTSATAQLKIEPSRAEHMLKSIMEVHYKAQGPLKGFSP